MSTCGVCHKDLGQEEISEVLLLVNGQETNIAADIHTVDGSPAHPDNLKGTGGVMVREDDRWEWRLK